MTIDSELPVYIVQGSNWTCRVPLNEYNASFDTETQTFEAVTLAIEQFKGIEHNLNFISEDKELFLGAALMVYLEGQPEKSVIIGSNIPLANAGFYKESFLAQQILEKETEQTKKSQKSSRKKKKNEGKKDK